MTTQSQFRDVMALVWRQAPALFIFSLLANLLLLTSTIYMLQVYDRVLSSGSLSTLIWLTVAAVAAIVAYGLLEQARRLVLGRISLWLDEQLSRSTIERSIDASLAGNGVQAGVKEVSDLRSFLAGEGILVFLDAPWTPVFLGFIWLLHPALGLLALCGAVLLFGCALANDLLTRSKQQATTTELRGNQMAGGQFVEKAETIRSLGMVQAMLRRWQERQTRLGRAQQELTERSTTIAGISRSLRLALQVAILGLGAYYVLQSQMTGGAMIAASIVLSRALGPIERSIGAWRGFTVARAAKNNLARLFASVEPATQTVELPCPKGRLSVEDLHCVAPGTRRYLLTKLSFQIEAGETCAVIGPSGAGKSTLCRMLVGAWKPALGHVRLDDAEVSGWPPEQLGAHLGYLPQQVELFSGTIAENIARLGAIDSLGVIFAAQLAGVHELILRLPDGYQTQVGPQAAYLSGGQRQRIGLARAFYGDPPLLILDEPNANLDSEGDNSLLEALKTLKDRGRSVVLITHQKHLLRMADHILVLQDGSARMFGPRADVLKALSRPRRKSTAAAVLEAAASLKAAAAMAAE